MAVGAYVLTTYESVKAYLGLTNDDDQALIEAMIDSVSAVIETFCQRKFKSRAYVEYYSGDGTTELMVDQYPVTAITDIWDDVNHDFTDSYKIDTSNILFSDIGSNLSDGIVLLEGDTFRSGVKNVKISYTAGYTTIPLDLADACIQFVAKVFNLRGKQGIESEKIGNYAIKFFLEDIPKDIKMVLMLYKDYRKKI